MNRFFFLLAALFLLGSCDQHQAATGAEAAAGPAAAAPAPAQTINSQQARALLARQPATLILDVRTGQEYAGGHLERARNLDYNAPDFRARLQGLDKSKPYLVYCAVGGRSSKASRLMQEMGFEQVYNVSEGFPQLKAAGLPVAQ